jgi:hypothetical protein
MSSERENWRFITKLRSFMIKTTRRPISLVKEKELGTMEQLMATPINPGN